VTEFPLTPQAIAALDELANQILARSPLIAFTGAGISTESGIPDYRGKNGLWTTGGATPLTYQEFMSDPERRAAWWRSIPERFAQGRDRHPNAGHRALVTLEQAGLLRATITQNIDGLHLLAGAAPERVIELHGNGWTIRCTVCGTTWPAEEFVELAQQGGDPPPCTLCGGILKSGVVAFGEPLPLDALRQAFALAAEAGVMLVVGSTLLVNPAARVPDVAQQHGAYLAIINHGETALDGVADLVLDAPAGPSLSYLSDRVLAAVTP
jgi:NAD-dependent deacetylase